MNEKQDAYVESIYNKAMIARSQAEKNKDIENQKKLEDNFWTYVNSRLNALVMKVMELYDNPNISKSQLDTAEKNVSYLLTMVNMNTLPEVINQLTADELKKVMLKKMENKG